MNVLITGAAGRISYSLIPLICNGSVFGNDIQISLRLLDMEVCAEKLEGIKMEIEDSCYSNVVEVITTFDPEIAYPGVDVAILLGGFPRLPGMERKDLIAKNAEGMKSQAESLNRLASKNCKVLVVANPANTNCLVGIKSAGSIPAQNFSCLTRLDQERLKGILAKKVNSKISTTRELSHISAANIEGVFIFGNHSTTQTIFTDTAVVSTCEGNLALSKYLDPSDYDEVLGKVQSRGAEILRYLQASSSLSAANAIAKHLQDWLGPEHDRAFSMGVISNGNAYGIPDDLVYSFPCKRVAGGAPGEYYIVNDLTISPKIRDLLEASTAELVSEKLDAEDALRRSL